MTSSLLTPYSARRSNALRSTRGTGHHIYAACLFAMLLCSSNIFLLNQQLAVKAADGGNLLGPRDVFMAATLVTGFGCLYSALKRGRRDTLLRCIIWLLLLIPVGAIVGIVNGGAPLAVARECFTILAWGLAPVVAMNVKGIHEVVQIVRWFVWLGVLVAAGVYVEIATHMGLRMVTPSAVELDYVRPFPSAWPVMMLATSIILTNILLEQQQSVARGLGRFAALAFLVGGALLTQSRTLAVGIALSTATLLGLDTMLRRRIGLSRLCVAGVLIATSSGVVAVLGDTLADQLVSHSLAERYSILLSLDKLIDYSDRGVTGDHRRRETEAAFGAAWASPLWGVGLGTPYRELFMPNNVENPMFVHNIYGFFAAKFGFVGVLLYLWLQVQVLTFLYRTLKQRRRGDTVLIGLAVGVVNLFACAPFGNVFGQSYMVQFAMVGLGCLIWWNIDVTQVAPQIHRVLVTPVPGRSFSSVPMPKSRVSSRVVWVRRACPAEVSPTLIRRTSVR